MNTVAQILGYKPDRAGYTREPTTSAHEAVRLMADKDIGALLVMDGEAIAGIVTERDYARKIAILSRSSRETRVADIMTCEVMYVNPLQTSDDCMALMTENRLRHLPVIDGGRLTGLISIGDLVKGIISEQQFIIEQLEHYITGDRA